MFVKATVTRLEEKDGVYDIGYNVAKEYQGKGGYGNAMWLPKEDTLRNAFAAAKVGSTLEIETAGETMFSTMTSLRVDGINVLKR